jgi:hypothetical protein
VIATCELCWREARYADRSAVCVEQSGIHGPTAYRDMQLCPIHAAVRRESSTSRVRCLHVYLNMDGMCDQCGADCR